MQLYFCFTFYFCVLVLNCVTEQKEKEKSANISKHKTL